MTYRQISGVLAWESSKTLTLSYEVLLIIDDRDILLCEVANSFVFDFPKIFGDLRNETWS